MANRKVLLIINPISGTGNKQGLDEYVRRRLALNGMHVTTRFTTAGGDATFMAREAVDGGYDSVIAAGGDGTINETATALCDTSVALGILPCGSGNGLARHIGIPIDIEGALDVIAADNVAACDYGSVGDRPFFCTFGAGFDATVSEAFANAGKRGKMTYIKNTFREYMSYKPDEYTISANGNIITQRAFVVAVCNASQYGNNAYIAPHASITDGLLDVTIIHHGNLLSNALVGLDLMTGLLEHNMLIHTFRTNQATIERTSPGPVHIDGEPLRMGERLDVTCHPAALHIHVPLIDRPFRPIITPVTSMLDDLMIAVERLRRSIFNPNASL